MPGRVTTFLRNPSGNIAQIKKTSRSRFSSPDVSDGEESDHARRNHHYAVKMPDLADAVLKSHRLSLPFGRKDHHHCSAASLDWKLESPPIIFHGNQEESTGALLSGQMILEVKEDMIELESFTANLNIHVHHKRPFHAHCHDCQDQYTELKSWQFVAQSRVLPRGTHLFPFSALLDGHLPASMCSSLMSIAYEFKADASVVTHSSHGSQASNAKFERNIPVKRSLPVPDMPHHSIRLFPPTNIKSSAHYSTVIHPTGTNKVSLKLDGLMSLNDRTHTLDLWKLKKVTWKLEEVTKTVAPACEKHAPHATPLDEEGKKGVSRTEVRLLGEKHLHEGWKSDFTGSDGTVDMEFEYQVNQRRNKGELKYACDNKSRDGTEVTHSLLIELVVSKEYAPEGKPQLAAPTGTGRILRMHYGIVMTDHPGLGVSWDEEAPPVYQDVPPSPPGYQLPLEPPVDYEDLEWLDAQRVSGEVNSRRASTS